MTGMTDRIKALIPYEYHNAPIPGGGYVTGFAFHKRVPGILYARTDIGGVYRYLYAEKRWKSLIDHVTMLDPAETFPIAIALDNDKPERLYIACGINGEPEGRLCISEDYGESFRYEKLPTMVHGNLSGRGTGMRLVVDENDGNTLYFASQLGGLLKSRDRGKSWEKLSLPENYMTFVWVSPDGGTIVAGTAGVTTRLDERHRGHSMYVSYDSGVTFEELMQPEDYEIEDCLMNGNVASRYDYDGRYFYVTMNSTGRFNYIVDLGYSCDTGDVIGGRVLRYFFEDGRLAGYEDITPHESGVDERGYLDYGFGGVCSCAAEPGLLVCSTLCRELKGVEAVYISRDYGEHWEISLEGLSKGGIYFNTSYMKPEYNGGVSILHWLSDIKLNPFDKDEVWFNSGTGVFGSEAFTTENPAYHDKCAGIEETVHLNVYAPIDGAVKLLDIVGDLGAFAFERLDEPCRNSFDDAEGNRYITCINADLSDINCDTAIVTARGNWKRSTKGGLVRTDDGYRTFRRLPMPYGLDDEIDRKLHMIEEPNVNAGWVAMSPDTKNIVWSIADCIDLPAGLVVGSHDGGNTYFKVKIYQSEDVKERLYGPMNTENRKLKVFSDRVSNQLFYGFGESGQFYVSTDAGESFYQRDAGLPKLDFGEIDTADRTEIRAEAGKEGVLYIAAGEEGLFKLTYSACDGRVDLKRLSMPGDKVFRMGLGLGREGGDYIKDKKAIYLCGVIDGRYGFFRTFDEGLTYEAVNTDGQMFGDINSIDGDKRVFGRFFIATGSRGVIYGEPVREGESI